jgi:hypothetical protein
VSGGWGQKLGGFHELRRVNREADYCSSFGRSKQAAQEHSGDWSGGRDRHCGYDTDPKAFRSGRDMAAWIVLVPRQDSTGGKQKLGPNSKQADRYFGARTYQRNPSREI